MTCHEFWNRMPELEAEPEALEHARQCTACAALLQDQHTLAAGLRHLAKNLDRREASPGVEARLVREFWVQAGLAPASATGRAWRTSLGWAPAAAAVIALAVFLIRGRQPEPPSSRQFAAFSVAAEQGTNDPVLAEADFIPLPYSSDPVATEDADLVSVEVPPSALVALGLPVAADAGSGLVRAVVALGKDGVVQAVRVLQ
ncbi:MAG: hypothetical protein LAP40_20430 [Acidobacteriia bacterium]|nr:hypothetical protein [Terriglobia bacterium]